MYYMLECFDPEDWEDSAFVETPRKRLIPRGESWTMGRRFTSPPIEPIEFSMGETHNDQMLEFRKSSPPLMSNRLLGALKKAGVDNIDAYETIIRHPTTDYKTSEWSAINIIGLVSAANLQESNTVDGFVRLLDTDFEGVAIESSMAKGFLIFRLAESTNGIVVHESVKRSIEEQGIDTLTFMNPAEWIS